MKTFDNVTLYIINDQNTRRIRSLLITNYLAGTKFATLVGVGFSGHFDAMESPVDLHHVAVWTIELDFGYAATLETLARLLYGNFCG